MKLKHNIELMIYNFKFFSLKYTSTLWPIEIKTKYGTRYIRKRATSDTYQILNITNSNSFILDHEVLEKTGDDIIRTLI